MSRRCGRARRAAHADAGKRQECYSLSRPGPDLPPRGGSPWDAPTTSSTPTATCSSRSTSGRSTSTRPIASGRPGSSSTPTARSACSSRARSWAARRASASSGPSAPGRARCPTITMKYVEGRPGGFDPHARIPDMDLDGIDAAFLYPSVGPVRGRDRRSPGSPPPCAGPTTAGSPTTASPTPIGSSAWPCCRCSRSSWPSRRCASRGRSSACAAASSAPTPTTAACCTTRTTSRSGTRWRSSTSRSACTRARAAACRRSAWTASRPAAPGTSSRTRWR